MKFKLPRINKDAVKKQLKRYTFNKAGVKNLGEDVGHGLDALSDREKEIVHCVAMGMTNKEIADTLCLSINTVTTHRRNITSKLQIHTPNGLTIYALVNKLVKLNEIKMG